MSHGNLETIIKLSEALTAERALRLKREREITRLHDEIERLRRKIPHAPAMDPEPARAPMGSDDQRTDRILAGKDDTT